MIKSKRILIFGGTGSLGKNLINRYIANNLVFIYSRDEAKHWTLKNELKNKFHSQYLSQVQFIVGDIRDKEKVYDVILSVKPEIIIVASALKQVDTCELSPSESIQTNITGTENVISAVNKYLFASNDSVKLTTLFVSTDKACSPVNVYGMCKSISERLITSQSQRWHDRKNVKFLATRYGNVLESRGSIIPLFKFQAENASEITVTDPEMTRYVMTLNDSADLIDHAITSANSGTTLIPILQSMKIGTLANIFSRKFNKQIKIIGLRPGEKKHEDLVNESESVRTTKVTFNNVDHYIIKPAYLTGDANERFTYSSADDVLSEPALEKYLDNLGIFNVDSNDFVGVNIEEIRK